MKDKDFYHLQKLKNITEPEKNVAKVLIKILH